jgi:GntR family transcriptional repressor for pyruvate dehydrogenase complex
VLAAKMEISRPTLREAIRALVESGLIEVKPGPGGGMFVRSDVVPRSLRTLGNLRLGEVAGVLDARRLLEPRVAQLAALYATDDDFDVMQRTIDLQRECQDDWERFAQLGEQFHLALARATRNWAVVELMRLLLRLLAQARQSLPEDERDTAWAIDIHERTLAAIKSGDPAEIDAAMEEHIGFLERLWEDHSGRSRLRRVPGFLVSAEEASSLEGARD